MERLIIKNFGPITDADIVIKDINIYIGTTSSGKSTVAKLVSIFKSGQMIGAKSHITTFKGLLISYNIDFQIFEDTTIRYEHDESYYEVSDRDVQTNLSSTQNTSALTPIYIPAERVFFSTFSQSILSLLSQNVAIPKWLIDFGARFEKARLELKKMDINFLDIQYVFEDGNEIIKLKNSNTIKLSEASSGIQSSVPLLLVVKYNTSTQKKCDDIFVIEEPELNLYPSSQKDLIEFIIGRINHSCDKLIVTTHSPYLLTSIDNLIQAGNVAERKGELKDQLGSLVDPSLWIKFDNVACYYFNDGIAKSTLDYEINSIGPSNIDDVSGEISDTFEKILTLKYSD